MKKKTIWGNHLKLDDKKKESAKANIRFCAARDVASVPIADERLVVLGLMDKLRPLPNARQTKNHQQPRMAEIKARFNFIISSLLCKTP